MYTLSAADSEAVELSQLDQTFHLQALAERIAAQMQNHLHDIHQSQQQPVPTITADVLQGRSAVQHIYRIRIIPDDLVAIQVKKV